MRKELTNAVRRTYNFPPREISKAIVNAIVNDSLERCDCIPPEYKLKLQEIASSYKKKCAQQIGQKPRTLPLYLLIKERYPSFQFSEADEQIQVGSYFRGVKPSILALLLELIPAEELTNSPDQHTAPASKNEIPNLRLCDAVF